jgi:cob(I)alamin adenosyltransferase
MKIYTRTGDAGTTSLVGGTRAAKDDMRLEAYGTVDELNSHLGLIISQISDTRDIATLTTIQNKLFNLGASLATPPDSEWKPTHITDDDIRLIEDEIDRIDNALPRHNQFILPGGSLAAASTHVARTVARRAERRIVTLAANAPVDPNDMKYVNRLSDYLFVLSRKINIDNNIDEIFWNKDC